MQLYLNLIAILLLSGIALLNLALELRRDLMMLQQNSYRAERYMRWLGTSADKAFFVFGNRVPAFASSAYGSCLYIVNVAVIA